MPDNRLIKIPSFISFTGADNSTSMEALQNLHVKFPVEIGVLVSKDQSGRNSRFPDLSKVKEIADSQISCTLHVCGDWARNISDMGETLDDGIDDIIRMFSTVQLNLNLLSEQRLMTISDWKKQIGGSVRHIILQCDGSHPRDERFHWLYDRSKGTGTYPREQWPAPIAALDKTIYGYAGGVEYGNIREVIETITRHRVTYWLDMESSVRTEGKFDLKKVELILDLVYNKICRF